MGPGAGARIVVGEIHALLKIPRWDAASAIDPFYLGTGPRPIPTEAMKSIQPLQQSGGAGKLSQFRRFSGPAGC